jgi:hypothetical protein
MATACRFACVALDLFLLPHLALLPTTQRSIVLDLTSKMPPGQEGIEAFLALRWRDLLALAALR